MQSIFRIIIGLGALLFLAFGAIFMFAPDLLLDMWALDPEGADNPALAWSTVRGDLGAFFLTLGAAMAIGVSTGNKTWVQAAMMLLGLVFIGRAVGFAMNGGDQQVYVNMGAEAFFVLVLWLYSRGLD